MRERMRVTKTLNMTEKMELQIQEVAATYNCSFAEVVRACVENDLPKLKERLRKQTQARKKQRKPPQNVGN